MATNYQAYLNGRRKNRTGLIMVQRGADDLITFDEDADRLAQLLNLHAVKVGRHRELILSEGDLGRLNGAAQSVNVVQAD